jgi:hypothetical protein
MASHTTSVSSVCGLHNSIAFHKRLNLDRDQGVGGSNPLSPTNKWPNSRFLHMQAVFGCLRSRRVRIWRQILSQAHARILTPLFSAC